MPCCGQVIDTIRKRGESYELLVEHGPELEDFYIHIEYCPFCGVPLDVAQQIYEYNLDEMSTM